MASTSSVSGLVSGLDTTTIIKSLMALEAKPQTLLKTKLSTETSNVASLQGLNAKLAALATKAADLTKAGAWSPMSATSSSTSATATVGSSAVAGTLSFTVGRTASAHQLSFTDTAARTDVVTSGSTTVSLTKHDGTVVSLDTGDGTLAGLASAINKAGAGVSANTVKLDDGTYRLNLVSTSTGAASDFTLTNEDGSALLGGATATAGQDAEITVAGDTIHSATNTFAGLAEGLDVSVAAGTTAGTAVTVTVARDGTAAKTAVKGLVDAANEILTQIDKLTAYDATTKSSAALAGDATVRSLRSAVLDTVTRAADGGTMAGLGIQTDRYGAIVFDEATFTKAYTADPTVVATKLGAASTAVVPGFAARLQAVAKGASDSVSGSLTSSIKARQSNVDSMQNSIDDWDVRLAAKEEQLNKQYAALEVALQKLNSQSSWLASQVSGLSKSSDS